MWVFRFSVTLWVGLTLVTDVVPEEEIPIPFPLDKIDLIVDEFQKTEALPEYETANLRTPIKAMTSYLAGGGYDSDKIQSFYNQAPRQFRTSHSMQKTKDKIIEIIRKYLWRSGMKL